MIRDRRLAEPERWHEVADADLPRRLEQVQLILDAVPICERFEQALELTRVSVAQRRPCNRLARRDQRQVPDHAESVSKLFDVLRVGSGDVFPPPQRPIRLAHGGLALDSQARQLGGGGDEWVAIESVLAREVDGAVQLEHGLTPARPGADRRRQSAPAASEADGDSIASGGGSTATRVPPRAIFVSHSPGATTREIAPPRPPRRRRSGGRTQRAARAPAWPRLPLEPAPMLDRAEMAPEGDLVAAELDVAAPAAETGLDDDRPLPVRI